MDWLELNGKTAIVTGGASGIGKAISRGLAAVGVNVVVASMHDTTGRAAVEDLPIYGSCEHVFFEADVTDKASVDAMVAGVIALRGGIDVLVNNAGINIPRLLVDPAGKEELTEEVWDRIVRVNQTGAFLCAQAVARFMIRNGGGVIINIASESGLEGSEGQSAYACTKAALYSLTRSWAKELGAHRIRVVGVAPGILEATDLRNEAYEEALAYTRGVAVEDLRICYKKTGKIPLGREGRLDEIADTVVYLASPRSSYIHGTVINVSGGKSRT